MVLRSKPADGTHWTVRSAASVTGLSKSTVGRMLALFGVQQHRSKSFKLSTDPLFVDKVKDIVGLDINPPDHAVVLCVDEKTQAQTWERTQPVLPLGLGHLEGVTHDYVTPLFAAHKLPKVRAWLAAGPRFHVHYTPTFASWLNQIERWFALLTERQTRRASCISAFVQTYNARAKPFVWTATSEAILEKVERLCKAVCRTGH
ncbi:hypothetical protein A0123_02949 [Gluconobacter cerinus]|uniref:Tc1-like transposase DDE domain-containing protein n=1 Tax=Gluconobacter cerinus TaxID=38307 RepID=A0A1B6VGU2_9PROT|nr:hypothetical protein A0123_02949 [Gluconobacter cerinus]